MNDCRPNKRFRRPQDFIRLCNEGVQDGEESEGSWQGTTVQESESALTTWGRRLVCKINVLTRAIMRPGMERPHVLRTKTLRQMANRALSPAVISLLCTGSINYHSSSVLGLQRWPALPQVAGRLPSAAKRCELKSLSYIILNLAKKGRWSSSP